MLQETIFKQNHAVMFLSWANVNRLCFSLYKPSYLYPLPTGPHKCVINAFNTVPLRYSMSMMCINPVYYGVTYHANLGIMFDYRHEKEYSFRRKQSPFVALQTILWPHTKYCTI